MGYVLLVTLWVWLAAEAVLWIVQFVRGRKAKRTEWGSFGAIILSGFIGGLLAGSIRRATPDLNYHLGTGWLIAVTLLVWLGAGFRLWAIWTLGRFFRPVVHIQQDHKVVRHGPYSLVRHPAYAGAIVALIGLALTYANPIAIVVYIAAILVGLGWRIRVEERVLLDGLGHDYADYMRTTPRLIPGVF
jgi:protein-S-isoprenylcysteine O-methyltransferase Ste14